MVTKQPELTYPKKEIDVEQRNIPSFLNIQNFPKIVYGLVRLFVLQRQLKVNISSEGLEVNVIEKNSHQFPLFCGTFLEQALDKNVSEPWVHLQNIPF
jgi:hypothetical protein